MRYRALFIGGPIDGQERVLNADYQRITISETAVYVLLFAYGCEKTLIYSVWNIEETLNRVWNHYTLEIAKL